MKNRIYKKLMLSVVLGFALCVAAGALGLGSAQSDISDSVLRLHVIANSDSKEDQELKLKIRDAILGGANEIFCQTETKKEAVDTIKTNIKKVNDLAQDEVKNQGYSYGVSCSLEKTYFPTRQYENFMLPAGEYDALKVVIGKGEGKNWWCVMFPPLCNNGIENKDAVAYFDKNLSKDEMLILTGQKNINVEFKFKTIELFENFKEIFKKAFS